MPRCSRAGVAIFPTPRLAGCCHPPECERWRDEWRARGSEVGGQVAVTGVSGWDTINRKSEGEVVVPGILWFDRSFALAFEDGLKIAGRDGEIPVYVLGMPCFAARNDGLLRNDPLRRAQLNMLAQLVVQRVPSAHFIDLDPLTCDEEVGFRKIGRKRYTSTGCTGHLKGAGRCGPS